MLNRVIRPASNLLRRVPALSAVSVRSFAAAAAEQSGPALGGGTATKGAAPISIEDLYGLCFRSEPKIKTKDREPQDMFDQDIKLHEVVIYLNGGLNAPEDQVTEAFVRHMYGAHVLYWPRDAGKRPALKEVLKKAGGSDELPQLWVHGKLVGKGQELTDFDTVYKLCGPAQRPWPREKVAYQEGFTGYYGITQSDKLHRF